MNNLTDLFNSEFKNLYALEKECVEILKKTQKEINDQDLLQIAKDLEKDSEEQLKLLQQALKEEEIYHDNVTDSVAQEMIENLKEISSKEIPQEVKDEAILGSFNRLNYYRMACYENTYELAKKLNYTDWIDLLYYEI